MSALSRSLVTPNKVASVLDWSRKAVMALDITENHVGISIGDYHHPSSSSSQHAEGKTIHRLDPVRLVDDDDTSSMSMSMSMSSHERVAEHIDALAKVHNVGAVVVGWPLQPEGNPGKPCGRVLHTLEHLMERKKGIVSRRRPFTLWDDRHVIRSYSSRSSSTNDDDSVAAQMKNDDAIRNDQPPDRWGRCVAYARAPTSSDGETYCSEEAYTRPSSGDGSEKASDILEHFLGSFNGGSSISDRERQHGSGSGGSGGGGSGGASAADVDYRKVTNDSWEEEALF